MFSNQIQITCLTGTRALVERQPGFAVEAAAALATVGAAWARPLTATARSSEAVTTDARILIRSLPVPGFEAGDAVQCATEIGVPPVIATKLTKPEPAAHDR